MWRVLQRWVGRTNRLVESERAELGRLLWRRLLAQRFHLFLLGVATAAVVAAYQLTHAYPAWSGGLYLETAAQVGANGYALPDRIPGYTVDGIPFAYPPLGFYLIALLVDVGLAPRTIALWLPSIAMGIAAVGTVFLGTVIGGSRRVGVFAAIALVTSPGVLRGTITSMGMVRGPALAVTTVALAVGIHLFRPPGETPALRSSGPRYKRVTLVAAILLFALVVGLHPEYAAFVGLSYVVFWLRFDRSIVGLRHGVTVALGGAVLTAPWWLTVVGRHGVDGFAAAAGTHGGILAITWPVAIVRQPPVPLPGLWPAVIVLCALFLVVRRDWFLPTWMIAAGFVLGREDHLLLIGSIMIGVVAGIVLPAVRAMAAESKRGGETVRSSFRGDVAVGFVVACLVVYGVVVAGLFVAGLPTFADGEDRDMMRSLEDGSRIAVVGDAGEWLGFYGNVTHTSAVRGTEWTGQFEARNRLRDRLATCMSAACIETALTDHDVSAESLYVALDGYSNSYAPVLEDLRRTQLVDSLRSSDAFALRNRSENVAVYTVADDAIGSVRPV